jgi:hypothetical protein
MGIDLGRFKRNKNDEWVEWLADDPIPAAIRGRMRAKAVQEASRPIVRRPGVPKPVEHVKQVDNKPAAVSIHISVPKITFKKPTFKIPPQLLAHKKWVISGAACFIVVAGLTGVFLVTRDNKKDEGGPAVLAETQQKADFAYSLPKGTTDGIEGDVRYNSERKLVNFKDSIGGVEITVSQQPLPEGFKEDTDNKVKKLAEDFSATKSIATANPTAYIGTSIKGPQTVIFTKKDLLVFIQSTKVIDEHDWAEYITNLQ